MGKGALNHPNLFLQEYSWEEIRRRNTKKEQWIVIDGYVYDVTAWSRKHPGGGNIIRNYAGEDASVRTLIFVLGYHSRLIYSCKIFPHMAH